MAHLLAVWSPSSALGTMLTIIVGTLGSEDLTGIAVGLLIRQGRINPWLGIFACFAGIYVGDLGLWLLGRVFGRRMLRWQWVRRRATARQVRNFEQWFERRGWAALFAVRFLPATRVPLYVAAGACGGSAWRFAVWSLVAAAVWTPLLVLSVACLGEVLVGPLQAVIGGTWGSTILATLLVCGGLRLCASCSSEVGRAKLWSRISNLWRWEFWPSWLFYLPVAPWIGWLALRHRSLTVWTAANPGIPQGGVIGESKFDILARLPRQWVVPSWLLVSAQDLDQLPDAWPMIFKPDASQRGAGVRRIGCRTEAEDYLRATPGPVIAQTYHPGPFEAGVFYYRLPGDATGHIFSITDKVFPVVVGDGSSTLEQLIWRHPRYRMQARVFLLRHVRQRNRVLPAGERFPLALAGNHCQGTMFRDGSHLRTPELESTIDRIARHFSGFFIGRFDVRYADIEAFRAGRDLGIVELNGVTSESTNIYDPSRSLVSAYRVLFRQWELLFRIGNANRERGIQVIGVGQLLRLVRDYYRSVRIDPLAD